MHPVVLSSMSMFNSSICLDHLQGLIQLNQASTDNPPDQRKYKYAHTKNAYKVGLASLKAMTFEGRWVKPTIAWWLGGPLKANHCLPTDLRTDKTFILIYSQVKSFLIRMKQLYSDKRFLRAFKPHIKY